MTADSHFDKLYFMNELMVGSVQYTNPIEEFTNEFTMALLQDSGWYMINPQQVVPAVWGKGLGCNFLGVRCEHWNLGNEGYYCTDSTKRMCTFNRLMYNSKLRLQLGIHMNMYRASLRWVEETISWTTVHTYSTIIMSMELRTKLFSHLKRDLYHQQWLFRLECD